MAARQAIISILLQDAENPFSPRLLKKVQMQGGERRAE
jgi:hypothetical protein